MNKENMDKLLAVLDRGQQGIVGFNMRLFIVEPGSAVDHADRGPAHCGTVACMAGHAVLLSGVPVTDTGPGYTTVASRWLGIDRLDADDLFIPGLGNEAAWNATPAQAARVLRHYVATGDVVWSTDVMGAP